MRGMEIFDLRKVVVDTGPLFNVLALVYVQSSPVRRHNFLQKHRLPEYLKNNPAQERNLLELFKSIQTIVTTSHVIGELTGLLKTAGLPSKDFWPASLDYLSLKNLDERLLRLIPDLSASEAEKEVMFEIGPTDAGLIDLARREKCILLTDDERTLARWAWSLGLGDQCKLVRNIL